MKKLLKNLLAISALGVFMLVSCKKNDAIVTATSGKAGALTASSTSVTLVKADSTSTVLTFSFTNANYGYKNAVITNTIQIDTVGDNWAKPVISSTFANGSYSLSYTTVQLNTMALNQLKIAAGKTGNFNVRVVQTLGATVTPVYSNVLTVSISPYSIVIPETFLYVVGAYQGWNLTNRDSLASKDGNIYTGIIDFTAGNNQFLILPDATDYNNKYATNDSSTPTATVAVGAPNNLVAPTAAGNYIITLNLSAKTITFALANAYSAIGSSTPPLGNGYTVDNDMKYVNGDQAWELTIGMVEAGGFKIRQNHDWTFSWGTLSTPDGLTLTDANGGNINITTVGTYKITFGIAPSAVGATPPITAPYTLVQQ